MMTCWLVRNDKIFWIIKFDEKTMLEIVQWNNPFFLSLGEMGTVAGWGRLSEGGQLPSILQYVRYFIY